MGICFRKCSKVQRAATGNQNRSVGAARGSRNAEVTVQSKDTIRLNPALKIYRRTHSRFPYKRSACVRALHSVRGSPAVISAIRKPSPRSIRSFVTNGFFLPLSISLSRFLSPSGFSTSPSISLRTGRRDEGAEGGSASSPAGGIARQRGIATASPRETRYSSPLHSPH